VGALNSSRIDSATATNPTSRDVICGADWWFIALASVGIDAVVVAVTSPAITTTSEVATLHLTVLSNTGWDFGVGARFDLWSVAMNDRAGFNAATRTMTFSCHY
jgi:hypothetical protein